MPFNLLLLPLLGGFIFTRYWNKTRYEALRSESERLLLLSSVWGLVFLIAAFVSTSFLHAKAPGIAKWWNDHIQIPYSGTACLSLLFGALGWLPLNFFYPRARQISKLIEENGDRFELLLKEAQDEGKMVSVTLKNGKFYTGFVKATLNPANRIKSVGIIPTRSGYRESNTKALIFTSEYARVYDLLTNQYDEADEELARLKQKLEARSADREVKAEEMRRVSGEARPDVIDDPNATRVRGELDDIDEEIYTLHNQIVDLENKLDKLVNITEDYETIIPVDEICILSIYDHELYQEHFAAQHAEALSNFFRMQ